MSQEPKIIDLRRSYVPMDPNAFPPTMHGVDTEDSPEARVPVIPYDGYNFMPTPQGYCSFFGTNSDLGVDALAANTDFVFVIQKNTFENLGVALTDTGIWTKDLGSSGAWVQSVVLSAPGSGLHENWSFCVLDADLFVYRQGEAGHWKCGAGNSYVFTQEVPTFINMAGQLGIFKAGGRLGYWDSEDSFSWSALGDTGDFTPNIETLAGNVKFQDLVGKTVNVLSHGTGFIIYATKSIVHVTRDTNSQFMWKGRAVFNNNGISFRGEVCQSDPDTVHFAMTTTGLIEIKDGAAGYVSPEASTYFRESRQPIYLQLLNGRYLFLSFLSDYYLQGRVDFITEPIGSAVYSFRAASEAIADWTDGDTAAGPCRALLSAMASHESVYLYDTYGYTLNTQASSSAQVPIWEDNIVSSIPMADILAFKAYADVGNPEGYFTATGFSGGNIPKISSGNESYIPTKSPDLVSGYSTALTVEANEDNFFAKQDTIFEYERRFYEAWLSAIRNRAHTEITVSGSAVYQSTSPPTGAPTTPVETQYTAGPYIDLSAFSEANKYYGIATKSAWLQRSFTAGKLFTFKDHQWSQSSGSELPWRQTAVSQPTWVVQPPEYTTYASLIAAITGGASAIMTWLSNELAADGVWGGTPNPGVYNSYLERDQVADAQSRRVVITMTFPAPIGMTTVSYFAWDGTTLGDSINTLKNNPVYKSSTNQYQRFLAPEESYVPYDTCVYKELGFTSITGHGHYDLGGAFIQDDTTDEAPDYVDQCTIGPPAPVSWPSFNGNPIANPFSDGYICGYNAEGDTVTVGGSEFSFTAEELTIPEGSILLQQGSIEPIYPTFLGAFIFDLHYKKWGKMALPHKNLLDIYPVNTMAGVGIFPYDSFMPRMGARLADGTFPIFDQYPEDAEIIYGKLGMYRKGFTGLEEVRIQHRNPMTGWVGIESSLDSKNVDSSLTVFQSYDNENESVFGFSLSARWYNIIVRKFFDIVALEPRIQRGSRR